MSVSHEPESEGVVIAHEHNEPPELDVNEPRTPMWMPLLGASLFVFVAIGFVATRPAAKTTEELRKDAQKALEAQKPAPPPEPAPAPMPPRPAAAQPMAQGGCGT